MNTHNKNPGYTGIFIITPNIIKSVTETRAQIPPPPGAAH